MTITETAPAATAEEFGERLFGAVLGAQLVQAAYLGDRLGYYRVLAAEPLTAPELAVRTGTAERYAREWLEHQAVAGVLTVDDPAAAPTERRFRPPAGHAEVLTDVLSPNHVLRSEEHTSELQSPCNLVCRLLLEKKKHDIHIQTC